MSPHIYNDVVLGIVGQIGIIKLNRPKSANTFGGTLILDTIAALRELDDHPDTIFTVITGEGAFFSAGADIKSASHEAPDPSHLSKAQRKLHYIKVFSPYVELGRALVDHRKIYVLALNGPAVGGGAAFFAGVSDLTFASKTAYMMVPFSALGLVPEMGMAVTFAHKIGPARANEFSMFGRKWPVEEMKDAGMVNKIFDTGPMEFQAAVLNYLEEMLRENEGSAMIEVKRASNRRLRDERIIAIFDATNALCEKFVDGTPYHRIELKADELRAKSMRDRSKM